LVSSNVIVELYFKYKSQLTALSSVHSPIRGFLHSCNYKLGPFWSSETVLAGHPLISLAECELRLPVCESIDELASHRCF